MSASSAARPRPTPAEALLAREAIANRPKHRVRCVTACIARCLSCLDAATSRNVYRPEDEVEADLRRGIQELGADEVIISGGKPAGIRCSPHCFIEPFCTTMDRTRGNHREARSEVW